MCTVQCVGVYLICNFRSLDHSERYHYLVQHYSANGHLRVYGLISCNNDKRGYFDKTVRFSRISGIPEISRALPLSGTRFSSFRCSGIC